VSWQRLCGAMYCFMLHSDATNTHSSSSEQLVTQGSVWADSNSVANVLFHGSQWRNKHAQFKLWTVCNARKCASWQRQWGAMYCFMLHSETTNTQSSSSEQLVTQGSEWADIDCVVQSIASWFTVTQQTCTVLALNS
jgi:hypothetical protein